MHTMRNFTEKERLRLIEITERQLTNLYRYDYFNQSNNITNQIIKLEKTLNELK